MESMYTRNAMDEWSYIHKNYRPKSLSSKRPSSNHPLPVLTYYKDANEDIPSRIFNGHYISPHAIWMKAGVRDVQEMGWTAVFGHLLGVSLMNVRGAHLRPGAHTHIWGQPQLFIRTLQKPHPYSFFCELWPFKQRRKTWTVQCLRVGRKIMTTEHLSILENSSIKQKIKFPNYK